MNIIYIQTSISYIELYNRVLVNVDSMSYEIEMMYLRIDEAIMTDMLFFCNSKTPLVSSLLLYIENKEMMFKNYMLLI